MEDADKALRGKAAEFEEKHKSLMSEQRAAELRRAQELVPEWRNADKRKADFVAMREYLAGQGYAESEIEAVSDARVLSVVRKAMLYDKLQSGKPALEKRAADAPKQVTAASKSTAAEVEAKKLKSRLKQTGDWRDAARLYEKLL